MVINKYKVYGLYFTMLPYYCEMYSEILFEYRFKWYGKNYL